MILKNDKTIIAYHFGQYYCLLQKEWRLPKIEIDWLGVGMIRAEIDLKNRQIINETYSFRCFLIL
jgi:hypothetical protein